MEQILERLTAIEARQGEIYDMLRDMKAEKKRTSSSFNDAKRIDELLERMCNTVTREFILSYASFQAGHDVPVNIEEMPLTFRPYEVIFSSRIEIENTEYWSQHRESMGIKFVDTPQFFEYFPKCCICHMRKAHEGALSGFKKSFIDIGLCELQRIDVKPFDNFEQPAFLVEAVWKGELNMQHDKK